MKNSEEMARSVLERAKEERVKQSRIRKGVIGAVVVFCVMALVLVGGIKPWRTEQAIGEEGAVHVQQVQPKITLLSATTEGEADQSMIAGVQVPQAYIRVRDITGMDEAQRLQARMEELELTDTHGAGWRSGRMMAVGKRTITSLAHIGSLYVIPEDYEQVLDYSVETTDNGKANIHHNPVKLNSTGEICTGIEIFWSISDELLDAIDKDPSMDLTQIKDTIKATVNFKDGSTEVVIIDITINEEGNIYAIYGGTKTDM